MLRTGTGPRLMHINFHRSAGARRIVVIEHRVARTVEVVELPAVQRAPEQPPGQEDERDGEGNEKEEAFHDPACESVVLARRSELSATISELAPMPIAASHGPIQPSAAAGNASPL